MTKDESPILVRHPSSVILSGPEALGESLVEIVARAEAEETGPEGAAPDLHGVAAGDREVALAVHGEGRWVVGVDHELDLGGRWHGERVHQREMGGDWRENHRVQLRVKHRAAGGDGVAGAAGGRGNNQPVSLV